VHSVTERVLQLSELVPNETTSQNTEVNRELAGVTAKVLIVNSGNCYFSTLTHITANILCCVYTLFFSQCFDPVACTV